VQRSLSFSCLVLVVSCATGCAAPFRAIEDLLTDAGVASFTSARTGLGRTVDVRVGFGDSGRGAVVGPSSVLTVAHVVGSADEAWVSTTRDGEGWVRAKVRERLRAHPEELVVLELELDDGLFGALLGFDGFSSADCYPAESAGSAARVGTRRGVRRWEAGALRPGDSGAPVVDDSGRLVGLVTGRRGNKGVYTPVSAQQVAIANSPSPLWGETAQARQRSRWRKEDPREPPPAPQQTSPRESTELRRRKPRPKV